MCRAFSCIVDQSAKVTWKFGVDSHTELLAKTSYKDNTADPSLMEFARVEITPNNRNYLFPDTWGFEVDEAITPSWLREKHKTACFAAHRAWLRKLDKILVRKDILNPFKDVTPPPKIIEKHIDLLRQWASVRASVWASVWASVRDSVGYSVGASVRASVGASVRDSVGYSVGASVRAYIGSFFILPKWKYIRHPRGKYPFAPCVKLWEAGLVPSFDGTTWRLHGGPEAKVLFEISAEKLRGKKVSK